MEKEHLFCSELAQAMGAAGQLARCGLPLPSCNRVTAPQTSTCPKFTGQAEHLLSSNSQKPVMFTLD